MGVKPMSRGLITTTAESPRVDDTLRVRVTEADAEMSVRMLWIETRVLRLLNKCAMTLPSQQPFPGGF